MDNTPQQEVPEESPPNGHETPEAPDTPAAPAEPDTPGAAETPDAAPPTPDADAPDAPDALAELEKLAQAAKVQRLAPAEEDHAVTLLLPLLRSGKSGITSLLETLVALPWIVGVNAVTAVWPEWTAVMRRHLLSGLAKIKSDQALRLRLSLARAIFKIEPAVALKIAASTLPDLLDSETGTLTPKHRQIFFNVLIGKGKPWLLQLPLSDFKPSEADTFVHCAIETFPFCPPLSQFSILRWTHAGGRFKKISEADLATITKSISRWNGKLQRQLKSEIDELPETITAVFKPAPAPRPEEKAAPEAKAPQEPAPAPESGTEGAAAPETGREGEPEAGTAAEASPEPSPETAAEPAPASPAESRSRRREREREERRSKRDRKREGRESRENRHATAAEEAGEQPEDEEDLRQEVAELQAIDGAESGETAEPSTEATAAGDETAHGDDEESRSRPRDRRRDREERRDERRTERSERPERPERPERAAAGSRQKAPFDFKESLRGLETYVASLRSELEQAKVQLRRKEEETRRGDRRRGGSSGAFGTSEERPSVDVEALQKHNAQLEQAVADLRQQLEDLASHHEAVAESRELHGNEPLPEGSATQLCKLLSIKLQEDYETYSAMRLEPLDRVFRLDYRDLLGQVFDVLIEQGVELRPGTQKG